MFNKELTFQGQIFKNIHYFFFFLFHLCHRHLALETAEVKVQTARRNCGLEFLCIFFLIFIFKFFSLFFPTYKKVAELSVGFYFNG